MTTNEAAALLSRWDNVYIITHERPDGDTLGSAAALCIGLRTLGKTAYVLPNPDLTPRYVKYVAPYHAPWDEPPEDAVLVSVDTATPMRLPKAHRPLASRVALSIDHHPAVTRLGARQCIQTDSAATGEIIFDILQALRLPMTAELALPLYLAVSTDTGCFRYANTTARTHRVAAALLETGIDCAPLNREMFELKTLRRFQIEALITDSMAFFYDGAVAVCHLTQAMLAQTGATEDDIDNLAALPRKIEGVEIGVLIKEQPDGVSKISVRTSEKYEANRICAQLSGGGHIRAAGCETCLPLPDARQAVLQAIQNAALCIEG